MSNVLDNLLVELIETHDPAPPNNISPSPEIAPAANWMIMDLDTASPEIRYTKPPKTTPTGTYETDLDSAGQLILALQDQLEDLKIDRDRWRQQAETAQQILANGRELAAQLQRRSWWKRLAE